MTRVLRAKMVLDNSQFRRGLRTSVDDARRGAASISDSFGRAKLAIAGVTAVAAAAAGAVVNLTSKQIDLAESLDKMAQRSGISAKELSTLKFATEQAGGSIQGLEKGTIRFARAIDEARTGVGRGAVRLKSLGIQIKDTDGRLKTQRQLLSEVANEFAKYRDGAAKTVVAQDLFGRSGTELIPLLNQGAAGIARLQQEARELGAELEEKTVREAAEFKDNLNAVNTALQGVGNSIARATLPALVAISKQFAEGTRQGGLFKGVMDAASQALLELRKAAGTEATDAVDDLQISIEELNSKIDLNQRRLASQVKLFNELPDAEDKRRAGLLEFMQGIQQEIIRDQDLLKDLTKNLADSITPADLGGRASDKLLGADRNKPKVNTFDIEGGEDLPGISPRVKAKKKEAEQLISLEQKLFNDRFQKRIEEQEKLEEQQRVAAERAIEQAEMFFATDTERLQLELEKQLMLVGSNEEAKDSLRRVFAKKQEDLQKAKDKRMVAQQKQAGATLISFAIQQGGKLARIGKAAAIFSAANNARKAFNAALAQDPPGPPFTIPIALAALAQGIGQVQQIKAQPIPSFQMGTKSAPGGLAVVGEQGRELVNIPSGSEVLPNVKTERLLQEAGGTTLNIENLIVQPREFEPTPEAAVETLEALADAIERGASPRLLEVLERRLRAA